MPFRVICKNCNSKIDVKDELLGQTRRCPKCKQPILLQPAEPNVAAAQTPPVIDDVHEEVPLGIIFRRNFPAKLNFLHKYLIFSPDRLIAVWESRQGWTVNVGSGFLPAKRNPDSIPDQGNFVLVELLVDNTSDGHRLTGLDFYKISARGALSALTRNDDEVLTKIEARCSLSKAQKAILSSFLRSEYMFDFLSQAGGILDYLANEDVTSYEIRP